MGLRGEIVVGRSEVPLTRAPAFAAAGGAVPRVPTVPVVPKPVLVSVRPGGWQTVRCAAGGLTGEPSEALRDLAIWTRSPACVVSVYEGGYALARGLATAGCWWEAWLNPRVAAAKLAEVPDDVDDMGGWLRSPGFTAAVDRKRAALYAGVPLDARGALAWARAAGFGHAVPVSRVESVLRSGSASAEFLMSALLDALGFPPSSPVAAPTASALAEPWPDRGIRDVRAARPGARA